MTKLDRKKAANFFKVICNATAEMTQKSGISKLLPKSQICDFAFDPCGYSMNSLERTAMSTIHVTPENGHSYASFEAMGYGPQDVDLQTLVDDVLGCFRPAVFSVALHVSGCSAIGLKANSWGASVSPHGYVCDTFSMKKLLGSNMVTFHTFTERQVGCGPVSSITFNQCIWTRSISSGFHMKALDGAVIGTCCSMQESKCDLSSLEGEQLVSTINPVFVGTTRKNIDEMMKKQIVNTRTGNAFFVMNIGVVLRLWKTWKLSMPCVHLFYAVKCNSDLVLLALLSALGAGFDVASKAEHDTVRDLANPCKMPSHILHAPNHDVHLTTFDSGAELYKLHKVNPQAEVALRIWVSDLIREPDALLE